MSSMNEKCQTEMNLILKQICENKRAMQQKIDLKWCK